MYLLHLAVILWWLLDKSPEQRATDGLLALLRRAFGPAAPIVRLPPARRMLLDLDALVTSAFMNAGGRGAYLDALDAVESEP